MNVCLLSCFPYPGTSSTAYYEYSQELAAQGIDVTVIASYMPTSKKDSQRFEKYGQVDVYSLPVRSTNKKSIAPTKFGLQAFSLAKELAQQRKFDILQVHAFPALGLALYPFGMERYISRTILDIRTTAISSSLMNSISKLVLRFQKRLFSKVVTLDPMLTTFLFGDDAYAVETLPIGANFRRFFPGRDTEIRRQLNILPDEFVFIYVGTLHPSRNVINLIRAFSPIARQHSNVKLMIVGDGIQKNDLQLEADRLAISDQVVLTGRVPFIEIPNYIRAADVGIAYIPDTEYFRPQPPLKTIEYLTSGLPTIATNTPGNQRFITDRTNGLLVQDQIDDLTTVMKLLIEDEELRAEIASHARSSIEHFSYEAIVKSNLIPLYQKCIAEA